MGVFEISEHTDPRIHLPAWIYSEQERAKQIVLMPSLRTLTFDIWFEDYQKWHEFFFCRLFNSHPTLDPCLFSAFLSPLFLPSIFYSFRSYMGSKIPHSETVLDYTYPFQKSCLLSDSHDKVWKGSSYQHIRMRFRLHDLSKVSWLTLDTISRWPISVWKD